MDLKEAWKIYRDKAHVNRFKTRIKVSRAYDVVSPFLRDHEKKILGEGLVQIFMGNGRGLFNEACRIIEARLFGEKR
jgi:hypothetical protein